MVVKRLVVVCLLAILLFVVNTAGIYVLLTSQRPLHVWDFQPLWQAGRWILQEHGNPYSEEMTLLLQQQSYGRPAQGAEDPRAFVYPLYVLVLVWPLALLPLPLAQAAWLTALEFGVALTVLGALRLTSRQSSPLESVVMVVLAFCFYPITWAWLLGQVSVPIGALVVGALLGLQRRWDILAGACLALTTSKPQMSFLLVPALLAWGLWQGRYRFLASFAAAMVFFLLISFAVLPGWVGSFLGAGSGYFSVQPFAPPVSLLGQAIGGSAGQAVMALLVILLLTGLVWAWWRERRAPSLPICAASLTLVVTALIAPRTSIVNQTSLIVPLCLLFSEMGHHGPRGQQAAFALGIILLGGIWVIDSHCFPTLGRGEHGEAQHWVLSPILPTLLLGGLGTLPWWGRKEGRRT